MKKRMSWYWAVPGATGLALIMAAVMLLVSTAGHTPTASAQDGCVLSVTKTVNHTVVLPGTAAVVNALTYTITVENTGAAQCTNVAVTDDLAPDLECTSQTADHDFAIDDATVCDGTAADDFGAVVEWDAATLDVDEVATLTMTVDLGEGAAEGETIANEAVAAADAESTGDTASVNVLVNDCVLDIEKDADPDDEVGEGGEITYTIHVEATAGDCEDVFIVETIPDGTDCTDTSITDETDGDLDVEDAEGCDTGGEVTWDVGDLTASDDDEDEAEVTMTVDLESGTDEDEDIVNTACATFSGLADEDDFDAVEDLDICDGLTIDVEGVAATRTPTAAPTATRAPTVQAPPTVIAPPPVVPPVVAPTISPPITGTGGDSGSSAPLAIGLGLAGLCLLLVSGAVAVKRTR